MGHRVVGRYRVSMARGTVFPPGVPRLPSGAFCGGCDGGLRKGVGFSSHFLRWPRAAPWRYIAPIFPVFPCHGSARAL